ncbi:hypothetical protein BT69DRAFT_1318781 [Atractiella rhizophila]|nr:hypothetical protein BT69DRAFT_1318781 [Atractiella rhizophila]
MTRKLDQDAILPPRAKKPKPNRFSVLVFLRDGLPLSTWIGIGGLLQVALTLLSRYIPFISIFGIAIPTLVLASLVPCYILFKPLAVVILVSYGWMENKYMRRVVADPAVAVVPGSEWREDGARVPPEYCVILLGARSNGPMGSFDRRFKLIGEQFRAMIEELDNDPSLGCWNHESWLSLERNTSNTIMTMFYFESPEKVYAFIKGKIHTLAEKVYYENAEQNREIEIWHEMFTIKEKGSEAIYVNAAPKGLGNIWTPLPPSDDSKDELYGHSLHAPTGRLRRMRNSRGRMGQEEV